LAVLCIAKDDPLKPSMTTKLGAAATGGFFAAFLSLPFDLLKSRLQDVRVDSATGKLPYTGLVDCASKILKKEGPLAFWTGFGAYYGRCAPHAMIILLTLGEVNKIYTNVFNTG